MSFWDVISAIAVAMVSLAYGVRFSSVLTKTVIDDLDASRWLYPGAIVFGVLMLWDDAVVQPAWLQMLLILVAPFVLGFVLHGLLVLRQRRGRPPGGLGSDE